jgi:hypothetical protein
MALSRLIAGSVGTVIVGILAGFVLASVVGVVAQDFGFFSSGESPVARQYMLGLLTQNPSAVTNIRPTRDIAQRAIELQGAQQGRNTSIQPLSLTYLGGGSMGSISIHIYAVGLRSGSGVDQFFPLALTITGGKVLRSE